MNQQAAVPYRYTGQREEEALGLYDYGARWYEPSIGRFIQADTIVPQPGSPQSLNRYSYALNNPMKYTDPTGNIAEDETEQANGIIEYLKRQYGINIEKDFGILNVARVWDKGNWLLSDLLGFQEGVEGLANAMGGSEAFRSSMGDINVSKRHYLEIGETGKHSEGGFGFVHFCATGIIDKWLADLELDRA
jgi:RHS repeat-associated protein